MELALATEAGPLRCHGGLAGVPPITGSVPYITPRTGGQDIGDQDLTNRPAGNSMATARQLNCRLRG
ncbi:hypothetical protein [Actinacidiphila acididurans]|uniref:Uncharacterized protein n=1 Tax=Actinacidiphila acididurans TaxID=2784346 RepID=A0ABS2TIA6_9ACTN|nr:hypothetical protein [Actinacidiphila acididurans]MBM9503080.1 hypothetical protein [Actinacidiphila acididurans]